MRDSWIQKGVQGTLKTFIPTFILSLVSFFAIAPLRCNAEEPPTWAYPISPPDFKPRADDGIMRRVQGSRVTYSVDQLNDLFSAPVWYPGDHPPLPPIVARGRKPSIFACGFCHRENGAGGPENASLAGLPAAYIAQQVADFKSGKRKTSVPKRNVDSMIALVKDMTSAEIKTAANYFSSLKPYQNIKVIETESVPKTTVAAMFLVAVPTGEEEPIGQRIIEIAKDNEQFENRDPRSQFIAYVPVGSVSKGAFFVKTGGAGKTLPCATCHGKHLKGQGNIPSIVGRSPSYIVRQLYDIKHGARAGEAIQLMQAPAHGLTVDDMVAIAAYLASLPP